MQKASLMARLIAIILDSILLGIISGIVTAIVGEQILGVGVGFIIGLGYNWYFWTQNQGQTPGKALLGIRVVKVNGGPLSDLDAIIRYIGYYINTFVLLLGWIWAIFDDRHQGWHDKLAGTMVVRA
jgi:uncharacterized RDD family membrane protein YckC